MKIALLGGRTAFLQCFFDVISKWPCLELCQKRMEKHALKLLFFWLFFNQNRINNVFENELFFKIDFLMLLAPSCLHFGRGLGGVWGLLGASWAALWPHFFVFVFIMFSRRALGSSWARFWVDFEGFGRGLGRVLEVNIAQRRHRQLRELPSPLLK